MLTVQFLNKDVGVGRRSLYEIWNGKTPVLAHLFNWAWKKIHIIPGHLKDMLYPVIQYTCLQFISIQLLYAANRFSWIFFSTPHDYFGHNWPIKANYYRFWQMFNNQYIPFNFMWGMLIKVFGYGNWFPLLFWPLKANWSKLWISVRPFIIT